MRLRLPESLGHVLKRRVNLRRKLRHCRCVCVCTCSCDSYATSRSRVRNIHSELYTTRAETYRIRGISPHDEVAP